MPSGTLSDNMFESFEDVIDYIHAHWSGSCETSIIELFTLYWERRIDESLEQILFKASAVHQFRDHDYPAPDTFDLANDKDVYEFIEKEIPEPFIGIYYQEYLLMKSWGLTIWQALNGANQNYEKVNNLRGPQLFHLDDEPVNTDRVAKSILSEMEAMTAIVDAVDEFGLEPRDQFIIGASAMYINRRLHYNQDMSKAVSGIVRSLRMARFLGGELYDYFES